MSTEIATVSNAVAEKIEWAKAMAPAALLPKAYQRNPANLLLAAEMADALGIARINALTSIHVIEGRPSASADLLSALVRRAGHRIRVTEGDGTVTATLIRSDDPDFEFTATWSMQDAQRAGLTGKDVWKKYPRAMLRARALTEVIRKGASETLVGVIYTPEELGADVDGAGQPIHAQPITTDNRVTAAELIGEIEVTVEPEDDSDAEEALFDDDATWDAEAERLAARDAEATAP